jgi:hypothetical protein
MNNLKKIFELTKDEKDKICSSILSAIKAESFSKTVEANTAKDLSKYKAKLKKWCESESDTEVANLLTGIIEGSNEPDPDWVLERLSNIEFKRKAQKTDTLRKYFSLRTQNKARTSNLHLNKTIIQESIFKIPIRNDANVPNEELIKILVGFYRKNFPDYPIKLIVFHRDEYGDHPHIFVDGRNRRTGKYDLLTAQKKLVSLEYGCSNTSFRCSYYEKQLQAERFQTLFYDYANKVLSKYNLKAERLPKTQEYNQRIKNIEADAKLPKALRKASYWQQQCDEAERSYQNKVKKIEELLKSYTAQTEQKENLLEELDTKITWRKSKLDCLIEKIADSQQILENVSAVEKQKEKDSKPSNHKALDSLFDDYSVCNFEGKKHRNTHKQNIY